MSSRRANRTQVLIVGAGPVGLTAALGLSGQGFDVKVVDRDAGLPARGFPVVLHAQSLRILQALGAGAVLAWRGHPVNALSIRCGSQSPLALSLGSPDAEPALVTLDHSVLRQTLTHMLENRGVAVEWDTQLIALEQGSFGTSARLARTPPAQALPGSQPPADISLVHADYVIGADGYDSTVRALLDSALVEHGPLQAYAFFEGQLASNREARVVLSGAAISSSYPTAAERARFCVQLTALLNRAQDPEQLQRLAAWRLPECGAVEACTFAGVAEFRAALATRFGRGRVWLAGDAVHTTSPTGAQSFNAGLDEASELALGIGEALRSGASRFTFGPDYHERRTRQWRLLLGLDADLPAASFPSLTEADWRRLLPCLPATGGDLSELVGQLMAQAAASLRVAVR